MNFVLFISIYDMEANSLLVRACRWPYNDLTHIDVGRLLNRVKYCSGNSRRCDGNPAAIPWRTPRMFTSIIRSHSSTFSDSSGERGITPALFRITSTRPNVLCAKPNGPILGKMARSSFTNTTACTCNDYNFS